MIPAAENRIVITRDEANSEHVDALLKRQMSLKGESGVTAEPKKRWYYRNWLLFMIVAALAALGAWALIEPNFDDYFYVQGKIEALNMDEANIPDSAAPAGSPYGFGWVQLRGQKIWLAPALSLLDDSGGPIPYDPASLQVGQEIGAYTEYFPGARSEMIVASYLKISPGADTSAKSRQSVREQSRRSESMSMLIFAIVASMIGFGIGAADGVVCRLPKRAIVGGLVGALVGFVGGLFSSVLANVLYLPISTLAAGQLSSESEAIRAVGFLMQMIARMLAWTLAGCAMGLGPGIVLRSRRLLGFGFIGGALGGMLGGLLFDPIDTLIIVGNQPGAEWSRMIGFIVIGAAVGAMIGVVELLTRDAWLRMTEGPLAGKEFLMFRDVMNIGASPRSDIYLFNDDRVAQTHATLRAIGDEIEITGRDNVNPVLVNGNVIKAARLRHGDRIGIGNTSFIFEQRQR